MWKSVCPKIIMNMWLFCVVQCQDMHLAKHIYLGRWIWWELQMYVTLWEKEKVYGRFFNNMLRLMCPGCLCAMIWPLIGCMWAIFGHFSQLYT